MARLSVPAPAWDRFARWPRAWASAALAGFVLLLLIAAVTYPEQTDLKPAPVATAASPAGEAKRDTDLMLYDAIAERVRSGENYYRVAVEEQRARDFPVRPGLAVRLPTLALLTAWLGQGGMMVLGAVLALTALAAWWKRLADEPGGREHRLVGMALLLIGGAMGTKPHYAMLHEVWAGVLIALAFGLHRPGRWWAAWLAAAAALAIREHALPFVLLLGAMAAWRRDWREAAAWAFLAALFVAAMAWHLSQVSALLLASDRPSPPWLVLRGLGGWTFNLVQSSTLNQLPGWLAAPLALLPLLGWAGWRSAAGLTGTLLHAGYGLLFMLAGRDNNFYWALVVVPTWFLGLAFAPRALASLWKAALGKT